MYLDQRLDISLAYVLITKRSVVHRAGPNRFKCVLAEMFGSRYRYAGVTLGREFSSIIGGGVAPLICTALVTAFTGSWIPVAIYMSLTMLVSFIVVRLSPETLNRDLTDPRNASQVPVGERTLVKTDA